MPLTFPTELPAAGTSKKRFVSTDGVEVSVTNLEKVFWPDEGITKGDLLAYYFNIGETILPYLHDRPLALKRMPDGVTGKYFFQRNAPDYTPDWVNLCAIEPEDGKVDETVIITKLADLLFVANLGCIEMHPLHSRCERYDVPDYMVLDLDPMEPAGFAEALVIAKQVKVVLDFLELEGYPKTSGATGVQVYVPVAEGHSYDQTRTLAERIGFAIINTASELATMEWEVAERKGKVFIDHKMNRRAASLASVYSARPEPGGTVSTPLTWDEVDAGKVRPERFTMETIFERLEKVSDLFEELVSRPQELDAALETFGVKASHVDISEGRVR
jgi:bifunctional non-homologous end joining protein LigD